MTPRRIIFFIPLIIFLFLPLTARAQPAVPDAPSLTATHDTITVSWETVENADGYTLYWGASQSEVTAKTNDIKRSNTALGLSESASEGEAVTFTLGATPDATLKPETDYYVALASYAGTRTSALSGIESVTTAAAPLAPETPEKLIMEARTTGSVTLAWAKDPDANAASYTVAAERHNPATGKFESIALTPDAPIDIDAPAATFSGLDADTRYRFRVTATNDEGDSDPSFWLVTDTLAEGKEGDTLAPNIPLLSPGHHPPELLENLSVRLRFDGNNPGMADLKGYKVHYGTDPNAPDQSQEFSPDAEVIITGLETKTRYSFRVSAFDTSGNESAPSEGQVFVLVEAVHGLLDDPDTFEGGCFISTPGDRTASPFVWLLPILIGAVCLPRKRRGAALLTGLLLLLPATGLAGDANTLGIKAGAQILSDARHKEIYGADTLALTLFYQRQLMGPLSASLEAGYLNRTGKKRTDSGQASQAETELTLAPVSASLTYDLPLTPEITLFAGGGLDYWYYKETSDTHEVNAKDEDYGVGGYHGRAGLKLLTRDPMFHHRAGVILETVYAVIDRFGDNAMDLGGWTFNAGVFCTF